MTKVQKYLQCLTIPLSYQLIEVSKYKPTQKVPAQFFLTL